MLVLGYIGVIWLMLDSLVGVVRILYILCDLDCFIWTAGRGARWWWWRRGAFGRCEGLYRNVVIDDDWAQAGLGLVGPHGVVAGHGAIIIGALVNVVIVISDRVKIKYSPVSFYWAFGTINPFPFLIWFSFLVQVWMETKKNNSPPPRQNGCRHCPLWRCDSHYCWGLHHRPPRLPSMRPSWSSEIRISQRTFVDTCQPNWMWWSNWSLTPRYHSDY